MFNLNLYPIHLSRGKTEDTLPGLIAQTPPRKCARGREADHLVALIDLNTQANLPQDALNSWMGKKAALFYATPGSTTNALRVMAESINAELFESHQEDEESTQGISGSLCLAVLRKELVLTLVIGQGRVVILDGDAVIEKEDYVNQPQGLGVNPQISCVFSQHRVGSNYSVLLQARPNPQWEAALLAGGGNVAVDALVRRLLNQRLENVSAAVAQLSAGNGAVVTHQIQGVSLVDDKLSAASLNESPDEDLQSVSMELPPAETFEEHLQEQASADHQHTEAEVDINAGPSAEVSSGSHEKLTARQRRRLAAEARMHKEQPQEQVSASTQVMGETREKPQRKRRDFFAKPVGGDGTPPRSMLILLAIVIPLVVAAVAGSVYLAKGRTQQFAYYYQQGEQYVIQAEAVKDDEIMHIFNLQAALVYLEKASEFDQTIESNALLSSVQSQLDAIQGVSRLELTSLNVSDSLGMINITQMVATNNDLYLLDELSGKVLRYSLNGNMYVKDRNFDCGPNTENPMNSINKLVDILPLPSGNSFGATLLAIDVIGNIEFCIPGKPGNVTALLPPDVGWQEIKSIAMYQNLLYVLDPGNNGVYVYTADGILFEKAPQLFFDHVIPSLGNAIDIEVNADELYILRSNGEMVTCTYSHLKDYKLTECLDPASFSDMRSGTDPKPLYFPESKFTQMRFTPAPDSSLYILDTHGSSLFHFSLQRNLQRVIQPIFTEAGVKPKGDASSVAISPGKLAFLAFGNRVYYGPLP